MTGHPHFPSMCYFVETLTATFARWARTHRRHRGRGEPTRSAGHQLKRGLCQSVCSLGICLTRQQRETCGSICRASAHQRRSCSPSIEKPDVQGVSRSSTIRIARSLKKRFAGSTSSPSKDVRWPSAKRGRAKNGDRADRDRADSAGPGPALREDSAVRVRAGSRRELNRPVAGLARRPVVATSAPTRPQRTSANPRARTIAAPKGQSRSGPSDGLYDADEDWRAQDEDLDIDNIATSAKDDEQEDDKEKDKE